MVEANFAQEFQINFSSSLMFASHRLTLITSCEKVCTENDINPEVLLTHASQRGEP